MNPFREQKADGATEACHFWQSAVLIVDPKKT